MNEMPYDESCNRLQDCGNLFTIPGIHVQGISEAYVSSKADLLELTMYCTVLAEEWPQLAWVPIYIEEPWVPTGDGWQEIGADGEHHRQYHQPNRFRTSPSRHARPIGVHRSRRSALPWRARSHQPTRHSDNPRQGTIHSLTESIGLGQAVARVKLLQGDVVAV